VRASQVANGAVNGRNVSTIKSAATARPGIGVSAEQKERQSDSEAIREDLRPI
jgi:hypothetical protein